MNDTTPPTLPTPPDSTTTSSSPRRRRLAVAMAIATAVAAVTVVGVNIAGSDGTIDASVDDRALRLADAVADVEIDTAPREVIRIDASSSNDSDDDSLLPSGDDVVDTIDDAVTTVTDTLAEIGDCLLEVLPDVITGAPATDDAAAGDTGSEAPCDLFPSADDFGALDLGGLDSLDDVDLSDLGLPSDFDLDDIDVSFFDDVELPEIGDVDLGFDKVDFSGEVLDVITDIADEIVEFVEDIPGTLRDRFDGLFGD